MTTKLENGRRRSERRADALSKERIVEAAIDILDVEGESALTFRALSARLATGTGAIYWHVTDKNDLLAAATEGVVGQVMAGISPGAEPREAIRIIALGAFDAIDAHPWIGTQLAREPWQPAMLQLLESFGVQLAALGATERTLFDAASSLVTYILGVAAQHAAAARLSPDVTDRSAFLATVAARWTERDSAAHPVVQQLATELGDHSDREQFMAGIELILAGIGRRS